jgi:hypothetical protein
MITRNDPQNTRLVPARKLSLKVIHQMGYERPLVLIDKW